MRLIRAGHSSCRTASSDPARPSGSEPEGGDPWIALLPNFAAGLISGCFPPPHPGAPARGQWWPRAADRRDRAGRDAFAWRGGGVVETFDLPELQLLLLISFQEMLALGAHGVLWESGKLASDGLGVIAADASAIRLSSRIHGEDGEIEIETRTCALVGSG